MGCGRERLAAALCGSCELDPQLELHRLARVELDGEPGLLLAHLVADAMLGAVAFVPFRFVTGATGSSIPAQEVVANVPGDLARPADQPGC